MGCDKTTPSLLMGAASCDLPTIGLSGGPMLSGKFRGRDIGSGTGVWQMSEQVRSGNMRAEEFFEAQSCMSRSKGHLGRVLVFENIEDFHSRIDDDTLDIDESCVMVLKNCGFRGYPGMAEVGNMLLTPKLPRKSVTDMVRISELSHEWYCVRHR
jgi:dihydroxyacid dehydratase/phosphogluconate dehydratase